MYAVIDIFILITLCCSAGTVTCHQTTYRCQEQTFQTEYFSANMLLLVWSFYFTTFTMQNRRLFYYELSLKWPYCPKSDVKNQTYILEKKN